MPSRKKHSERPVFACLFQSLAFCILALRVRRIFRDARFFLADAAFVARAILRLFRLASVLYFFRDL
ncbi:hypothetical protein IJV57_04170 [Candidatus Saccharibacteria bacterium]|nr:hypothetical protein [Candidatus Saccharibacteria bacterium]